MSSQAEQAAASAAVEARSALRLSRSINATWWYIALGIVFFELIIAFLAVTSLVEHGHRGFLPVAAAVGGLLWVAVTLRPLTDYRRREIDAPLVVWRRALWPFLVAVAYGLGIGLATGLWTLGVLPVVHTLLPLNWPRGVRLRLVLTATALIVALGVIDIRLAPGEHSTSWYQLIFFAATLPIITVSSLWWWDVLATLDRARTSEARLAATQERLRLATDVHDLQGHHLQVIALQLELAERLMPRDPAAGLEQLRAARASVDDARQGTRDLATRFRSVPLRDELANAVDLLRASGAKTQSVVDPDAALAPESTLGPVIRETTTNVLRHGGGRWARLCLTRSDGAWRYEISNDVAAGVPPSTGGGSGLDGLERRAAEAGGTLEVRREDETFTVTVTVPAPGKDIG